MKKVVAIIMLAALVLGTAAAPQIAQAQGDLTQRFEYPGLGFSINYPAGWGVQEIPDFGYMLISDPTVDAENSETIPTGVSAVLLASMADVVGLIDNPALVLESFLGLESNLPEGTSAEAVTVAGYEAAYINYTNEPQGTYNIAVAFFTEDSGLMVLGIASPELEGTFDTLFQAMLDTLTVGEASTPPDTDGGSDTGITTQGDIPPIISVRVTLDQTITGSWNEIDTISLIFSDSDGTRTQWPVSATATSEYTSDGWSAMQATGSPDTFECGDIRTAWASATSTGQDSLTVTYGVPMVPTRVDIYQTYNPGAIVLVELIPADASLAPIVIFAGVDSTTDCPGVLSIPVSGGEATGANTGGQAFPDRPIEYGTVASAQIDDDNPRIEYTFEGTEGDVVTITMVDVSGEGSLDPLLILLDDSGNELARNDDALDSSVGSLDSQIPEFSLPYTGSYTVVATRFLQEEGSSAGVYELSLERVITGEPDTGLGGSTTTFSSQWASISYPEGWEVSERDAEMYSIFPSGGNANGDSNLVIMFGTRDQFGFGATLDEVEATFLNDIGYSSASRTTFADMEALVVSGVVDGVYGMFMIIAEPYVVMGIGGPEAQQADVEALFSATQASLVIGDGAGSGGGGTTATGDGIVLTMDYVTFTHPAGWTVTQQGDGVAFIAYDPGADDTLIMAVFTSADALGVGDNLYDIISGGLENVLEPDYSYSDQYLGEYRGMHVVGIDSSSDAYYTHLFILADDGGGEPFLAVAVGGPQEQAAEIEAIYNTVFASLVLGEAGSSGGSTMPPAEDMPIAYGETVSGSISSSTDYTEGWVFEGTAGDVVTITMIATDMVLDPYLQLIDPDSGFAIAYNDDAEDSSLDLNAQIAGYALPYTGTYRIEATSYGSSTGGYELTLEVVSAGSSGGK
ncbi:MAG: hypothetical protein JW910_09915 [Anaerolineae bacterium]|nr:hypothetical protein [Anaerolineae bacterium]